MLPFAIPALVPSLLGGFWRAFAAPLLDPRVWPGLALLAFVAFGWGWFKGDAHGDRQCDAASLRAEIARMKLETKLKDEQAEQEQIDTAAMLAEKERKEKEDAALIERLRKRPNKCLLGPDADRVQLEPWRRRFSWPRPAGTAGLSEPRQDPEGDARNRCDGTRSATSACA